MEPSLKWQIVGSAAQQRHGGVGMRINQSRDQQMLIQISQYYQIPDAHLQPYVQALMLKNNLSVFG